MTFQVTKFRRNAMMTIRRIFVLLVFAFTGSAIAQDLPTEREVVATLWRYGHFHNPDLFEPSEVTEADLPSINLADDRAKRAVQSWQEMMFPALEQLAGERGVAARRDGELDASTLASFRLPRCGHPDYAPSDDFGAVGSGSWPEPCQKAGVTFSVVKSGQPAITAAAWDEILQNVVATYAKVGVKLKPVESGQANIRISWRPLRGSTIGLAEFNNRSCSDSVFCYLDTGFNANKYAIMDLLTHELGHTMNLNHTRGGIMSSTLGSVSSFSGWTPSDPSWPTLKRYFGGEPIDPPGPGPRPPPDPTPTPTPEPEPQPGPNRPWLRTLLVIVLIGGVAVWLVWLVAQKPRKKAP
jgi:hypothetical protein